MTQKLSPELSARFYILAKSPERIDLQNGNLECFVNIINTVLTEENVYFGAATLAKEKGKFSSNASSSHTFSHHFYIRLTAKIHHCSWKTNNKQKPLKYFFSSRLLMFCGCVANLVSSEIGHPQIYVPGPMDFL